MKKAVIASVFAIWFLGYQSNAQTVLDVFPGGSGDGSSSQTASSTFLSGPTPVFPDYFGGSGDGSAVAQLVGATLNGVDNSFLFPGGIGNGSVAATTGSFTLSGVSQATLFFAGGSGDGSGFGGVSNIYVSGGPVSNSSSINFSGGNGDGISSQTSIGQFLSGAIPDFPFPGGSGRGSATLASKVVYLTGIVPEFLYLGGSGRGDAARKSTTLLLSGATGIARIAQYAIQDFKAAGAAGQVKLEWKATESPDQFLVESSEDGASFSPIGWLSAKKHVDGKYVYHAFSNGAPRQFFRVKNQADEVDLAVSDVIRVDFGLKTPIQLYPNPVKDLLHLESTVGAKIALVEIYDMNGRRLIQSSFSVAAHQKLNLDKLPPGLYRLMMQLDSGEWQEVKITKQ